MQSYDKEVRARKDTKDRIYNVVFLLKFITVTSAHTLHTYTITHEMLLQWGYPKQAPFCVFTKV